MRIAFITAGAAGMFCGSCMRDNTLVAALRRAGHDALLIPTYTPISVDEADAPAVKLKAGGWLGSNNRPYFDEQVKRLETAGLLADFEHVDCPTHDDKVRFMRGIDVLCVPTVYREPKGLYVLEAWANGVPAVLPAHGAFRELIEATGGGLLTAPDSTDALAAGLARMLSDDEFRARAGRAGEAAVRERFTADAMAANTVALLEKFVRTPVPLTT